jgi:hypothetical protein
VGVAEPDLTVCLHGRWQKRRTCNA